MRLGRKPKQRMMQIKLGSAIRRSSSRPTSFHRTVSCLATLLTRVRSVLNNSRLFCPRVGHLYVVCYITFVNGRVRAGGTGQFRRLWTLSLSLLAGGTFITRCTLYELYTVVDRPINQQQNTTKRR